MNLNLNCLPCQPLPDSGGLGIRLPSDREHSASTTVTSMLKDQILDQCKEYNYDIICDLIVNKKNISKQNSEKCKEQSKEEADCIREPPRTRPF